MGSDGCSIVGDFIRLRVLRTDEARKNLDGCGVRHAYTDPKLRHPGTYRSFVKRLLDSGLVQMRLDKPTEVVEAFFVGKKDGRLRMVIDCRRSNCWFQPPDPVSLCSAEALSRIELEPDSQLFFSTADLKDAFYHFSLPPALRTYFGMRPVLAGDIGLSALDGQTLNPKTRLFPHLGLEPCAMVVSSYSPEDCWGCRCLEIDMLGRQSGMPQRRRHHAY